MHDLIIPKFSEEEKKTLESYVTNASSNIFAWKLGEKLDSEAMGALLSRYSRSASTGREIFLREFLPNRNRGREFFNSWLVEYGDDSIQEMAGGMPVSVEYVSNAAAKELEDSRLASYIEKSTRYVQFDRKLADYGYQFYKDPDIMKSRLGEDYDKLMNDLFDSYSKYLPIIAEHVKHENPFEKCTFQLGKETRMGSEIDERVSEFGLTVSDIRKSYDKAAMAAALDTMRDYLPLSTLTHVGISANARSYEHIILKMLASELPESRQTGKGINEELKKIAPSLLRRVEEEHGSEYSKYIKSCAQSARLAVSSALDSRRQANLRLAGMQESVTLTGFTGEDRLKSDEHALNVAAGFIIYDYSDLSLEDSNKIAKSMTMMEKDGILSTYSGDRKNRRHKPGRALENISYTFDVKGTIGSYRDLQRHRIMTQERKQFGVEHGYVVREQYEEAGIADDYREKMERVAEMSKKLSRDLSPAHSQYAVTFGYNARWYVTLNARELFHIAELRTTPAGHPDYRAIVQDMHSLVRRVHPSIAKHMRFVNTEETKLGRLNSEIRTAIKSNRITA